MTVEDEMIRLFENAVARVGAGVGELPPIFVVVKKQPPPLLPSPWLDGILRQAGIPTAVEWLDVDNAVVINSGLAPKGCRWSPRIVEACWVAGEHPCEGCELKCRRRASRRSIAAKKRAMEDDVRNTTYGVVYYV